MTRLIFILIFLGFVSPAFTQTRFKSKPEPCQINNAPFFRGFTIGQTPEEIEELIPGFLEAYNNAARSPLEFGRVMVTSTQIFYKTPGRRRVPSEEYEDVDFFWHFYKGKLYFLVAQYNEFEPPNVQTYVRQVAEKTKLPLTGWTIIDKYHAELKCNGFKIELWTGRDLSRSYYQGPATVFLTDVAADDEIMRLIREAKERRIREENERKRKERERKEVFRP